MNETLNASISFICASRIHQQYWWRGISLQQDASAKGHIRGGGGRLLGHIYSSCQFIAVVPNSPGKFLLFDHGTKRESVLFLVQILLYARSYMCVLVWPAKLSPIS